MMSKLRFVKYWFSGILVLLLTSCTSLNTKVGGLLNLDTDLQLTFTVNADVNPDDNKTPSPLIIRMYELKSPTQFKNANFIDIYERDAEILGGDMLTKQSLKPVQPGENRKESFVLSKETKYVGLFAEFLKYKDAKYKLIIPVAQTNVVSSSAKIQLSGNRIIIL
ncbi:type VI secretion system lipoprotein TssJ [Aliikangiella coralliicola]|uniref:Type VI secretion system lipoprotein TssJ n=1 Tax=Aliikangiella coralliicola TaxID=2592383 RepID=A0A545U8S0_9GAMM|nr:type VI secretion system lipoprotein TssJ [Aliikangiella coralliicola]TQV85870.1 type VI secretion system lipoprotein TssJ [Aliikangiella coralliicola]